MAAPPRWVVYSDDSHQQLTERKLIRRISERDYSGHELIRGIDEGEEALRPLHSHPLFQRVHGVSPEDAVNVAHAVRARGFVFHLLAFLGVGVLTGIGSGSFPFWLIFWGIGLFAHFSRTAPSWAALAAAGNPVQRALGFGVAQAAPAAVPAPDPLQVELDAEWAAIEPKLAGVSERHAAGLRHAVEGARVSVARRAELLAHLASEDGESLDAEAGVLEEDLAVEGLDARTREVLQRSRDALDARRAAATQARAAADRLGAQVRALLHQLKSVKLSLAWRDEPDAPDLGRLVAEVEQQAESMGEIDEALADARQRATARRKQAGG